jgi:MFS transporter, DHA2 family, multidrug resistance protein
MFTGAVAGLGAQLAAKGADAARATMQAYGELYRAVIAQATTLAYIDTFWVLAIGAAIMVPLSFILARNDPRAGGGARSAAH